MNFKKAIITTLVGSIGLSVLGLSLSIAWFNSGENLFVDSLVIGVHGQQDLFISTSDDVSTFKDKVQYKLNEDPDNINDLNYSGVFTSVSSMFKSNWLENENKNEPEFYFYVSAGVDENYVPIPTKAEWGFYSQHLYLYCHKNVNATIDADSLLLEELEQYNSIYAYNLMLKQSVMDEYTSKYPTWTNEQIHDDIWHKLNELKRCMRIGIYDISENNFYIVDPFKEGETIMGGRADLFNNKQYDSYSYFDNGVEQSYEIIYGEVENRDKAVFLNPSTEDSQPPETFNSFDSVTKAGVHAFDYEASVANGLIINKEDSLSPSEAEKKILIPIKSGTPKEIVFTLYMEGWDTDCTNKHMGSGFSLDIQFKISEEKQ